MRLQDLHTHSLFDDGAATLEQMVQAAMEKGLSAIGLSGHSPIATEPGWTMLAERLDEYLLETQRLKEQYAGKITVFRAIEYDLRSVLDLSPYDYVIGSVHVTDSPAGCFDADNTAAIAKAGIEQCFRGDSDAAAECYFSQYAALAARHDIQIVAHFDIITKFNDQMPLYHTGSRRYLMAAGDAMERLVKAGKVFEVNSGAISRGYRTEPYPARELLCLLRELGGRVCLSSDAHSAAAVACAFDRSLALIRESGFREIAIMTAKGFVPVPLSEIEQ